MEDAKRITAAEYEELIRKFRKIQHDALNKGYTSNGGYCRGVSDCIRVLLDDYDVPEKPEDFETRGCC